MESFHVQIAVKIANCIVTGPILLNGFVYVVMLILLNEVYSIEDRPGK